MNTFFRNLALTVLLTVTTQLRSATWVRYEAEPGSKVKIDGTSTVHDWTVEGLIGGFMEADASFENDALKAIKINKVEVTIPVRQIKSGKSSMDQVMHDAMKRTEHPKIEYRLANLESKKVPEKPGIPFQFEATGLLTVSGVTRTNHMQVNIEAMDKRRLKVTGVTGVKMTDFGIKPPAPSLGLGFIKTGDDVKISIEWITGPAATEK
jgi:polyisoprenoid-binding protein YceI